MKFKTFESIIKRLKTQSDEVSKLYSMKIDLIEFIDPYHTIISDMLKEEYGSEGIDWWNWFCYERDFGTRTDLEAFDADNNPICRDVKELWELMEACKNDK